MQNKRPSNRTVFFAVCEALGSIELAQYIFQQGGVVGHDAIAAQADQFAHVAGIIDRPVLHGNVAPVGLGDHVAGGEREAQRANLVKGRNLQAGEVALVKENT